jgi:hypothetical protein
VLEFLIDLEPDTDKEDVLLVDTLLVLLIDTVDVLLLELLLVLVVDNEADFVFVELAVTVFVLNGLAELVVLSEYEDEGEGFDD